MQRQLQHVERAADRMEMALAGALVAQIGEALREHHRTGTLPANDLQRSFIQLVQATGKVTDASVGGSGHDAASEAYRTALERYQGVLRAYGVWYGSGGSVR